MIITIEKYVQRIVTVTKLGDRKVKDTTEIINIDIEKA